MDKNNLHIKDQVSLSLKRIFRLCISGIQHRLLRSLLTLSVIVLAISFFMILLTENSMVLSLEKGISAKISEKRISDFYLSHFYSSKTPISMKAHLVKWADDPLKMKELSSVTDISQKELNQLKTFSIVERTYEQFFSSMRLGQRIALIGKLKGPAIYHHLAKQNEIQNLYNNLSPMTSLRLPVSKKVT